MNKHPGFKKVATSVAAKQGVSKERANAIVAAGARKASGEAVEKNPRLERVRVPSLRQASIERIKNKRGYK